MTIHEGAVMSAVTGISCGDFHHMHEYAEKLLGRPIFTHEFAMPGFAEMIKEKAMPEFIEICRSQVR